jgi:hypothetical protein
MAEGVSCLFYTADSWLPIHASPCGFVVEKVALAGRLVFPCQYRSIAAPYSIIYHLERDKGPVISLVVHRHSLTLS